MAFLDNNGVTYLWSKLKSYVDGRISTIPGNPNSKSTVSIAGTSGTNYSTSIGGDVSRCYTDLGLVILSGQMKVVLDAQISAGTSVNLGKISNYKPYVNTPLALWQNSTNARRYMGYVDTDGTLTIKSNNAMTSGTYYIYYQAAYIATGYF